MSKCKKLFSIALAILLCMQLLLVPTFAEGETTQDTTVTGKYTTADNLPLIYGAGVSIEDFENCDSFTDVYALNYGKLQLNSSYFNIAYSLNTDATYVAKGQKSLAVNTKQNGHLFRYFIDLRENSVVPQYDNITFYVDLPAGSVTGTNSGNYPDGMYGIYFAFTDYVSQSVDFSKYTNYTVTYYFKDGTKLVKENQSGVYPYSADGSASTNGFEGYVSVKINDGAIASTNKYLMLGTYSKQYEGGYLSKKSYFDDFRCVDSDVFLPYATIQDFESVEAASGLKGIHNPSAGLWVNSAYDPDVNIVDTGAAQGTTALQFKTTKWGTICMNLKLKSSSSHNGFAFYVSIPGKNWQGTPKFTLGFSQNYWDTTAAESLGSATYTYYFEDGSILVKYGDDGIYPYDKNGNITDGQAFTGYVSVYYGNNDLSTYPYLHITVPDSNSSALKDSGGYIYLDDFRFCDYNTVEDLVSGDAYYVNDTAIPVQKVGDTATLSVMTNLAKLGMARNADGIAALRDVMLGYAAAAAKHNVNGDENTDIRDLVALYTLAAQ